jgi:hypothetical protein
LGIHHAAVSLDNASIRWCLSARRRDGIREKWKEMDMVGPSRVRHMDSRSPRGSKADEPAEAHKSRASGVHCTPSVRHVDSRSPRGSKADEPAEAHKSRASGVRCTPYETETLPSSGRGPLAPSSIFPAGHTTEGGTPSGRKGRMPSPRRVALDRSERKAVGSRQWGRILNYKLSVLAGVSTVRRNWGSSLSRRSTLRQAWDTAA